MSALESGGPETVGRSPSRTQTGANRQDFGSTCSIRTGQPWTRVFPVRWFPRKYQSFFAPMLTLFDSIAVYIAPTLARVVRFVVLSQINHFESIGELHTAADVTVTNIYATADVHWQSSSHQ